MSDVKIVPVLWFNGSGHHVTSTLMVDMSTVNMETACCSSSLATIYHVAKTTVWTLIVLKTFVIICVKALIIILALTQRFFYVTELNICEIRVNCSYIITPWSGVLLEKLTGSQVVKKSFAFNEPEGSLQRLQSPPTVPILSHNNPSSPCPHYPISCRSILILSSHLHLGLPGGLLPSRFPTKLPYARLLSPIRVACHSHLILLDFITRIMFVEEYRSLISSLCNFFHSLVTSPTLAQIFSSAPYSHTPSVYIPS